MLSLGLSAFGTAAAAAQTAQIQQEKAARAVPSTERALRQAEKTHGPVHPKTRSLRSTLAGLYQVQRRYPQAIQLIRYEADMLEKAEGPQSVNLAGSLSRLADVYRKMGQKQEADRLLQKALQIYRGQNRGRQAGQETLQPRPAAAAAAPPRRTRPPPPVMRAKRTPAAKPVPERKSVPAFSGTPARGLPVSGARPKQVTTPEAPVAAANPAPPEAKPATAAPRPAPAKPRELTLRERQYLDHADRLDQEAGAMWWQQRIVDVERRYREALRYREAVHGPDHPDVAQSLIRLARLYWGGNRNDEASALHRRAINILERKLPSDSSMLAEALWEFGGFVQIVGDYALAEKVMGKALKIFEIDPAAHSNISRRRAAYGTVLKELGRGEEAAQLRRR